MRIKKTYRSAVQQGKVLNERSTSQDNTYSCDYLNKRDTYSTDEQVVGTWVDGKPIYRKVIIVSRQFNTGNTKLNHNISNFGTLIDIKGSWTGSSENFPIIDVTPSALTYSMSITGISSTQINVNTASGNAGTWTMNLILEYTKTTDTLAS